MIEKQPFDTEELNRAVSTGNIHHSLNNHNLEETIRIILGESDQITQEYYEKTVLAGNYLDFDLEKHGLPYVIGDLKLLTEFLRQAVHIAKTTTTDISKTVGFIGCGRGRLAVPAIELAKKLGIEELLFNDLFTEHIDITREKIAKVYGTRSTKIEGVKLSFSTGDFTKVSKRIRKKFDALFAMWFVTSEIADFSSVENLRRKREQLFSQIKKLLTKQGVFIEDIPYSEGVGAYYYLARLKTYNILHQMGILEGENNHMLATNFTDIQKTGFPHHIRYVPSNGKHRGELENAGFEEYFSRTSTLPNATKSPQQYENEFGNPQHIKELFAGNAIDDLLQYLTKKEYEFLSYPSPTHPMSQQKKTIMWRQKQAI